jgi:hypothetical protein
VKLFEASDKLQPNLVFPHKQIAIKALPDTMPGGMLSVSANENGKDTGIVWATLPDTDCTPGKFCPKPPQPPFGGHLYAFHAETLDLLWHSHYGINAHWVPPTIAGGRVYVANGEAGRELLLFELGRGGTDRQGTGPPQPQQSCGQCHTEQQKNDLLSRLPSLGIRFDDEASVRGRAALNLKLLAPPSGLVQDLVMEGDGVNVYVAAPDTSAQGKILWVLKESSGTCMDVSRQRPANENASTATVIRLEAGNKWSASDGSALIAKLQGGMPAPEHNDADWMSFQVTKTSPGGILAQEKFIQCVFTHAGHAPAEPPRSKGAVARVKFHAEYRFFR